MKIENKTSQVQPTWYWNSEGVEGVDWSAWDALIERSEVPSVFLDSRMMQSLMRCETRNIAAVVWNKSGQMLGIAQVEDAIAESLNLDDHIAVKRSWFSFISRLLHGIEGKFRFRVRVIGPVLGSGMHSSRWEKGVSDSDQRRLLSETVFTSASNTGSGIPKVAMLKDIPIHYSGQRQRLHPGWIPLEFDPEMLLHLDPEWQNMTDYMGQLNTKARTKVKRVLKVSEDFKVSLWSSEKLDNNADALIALYGKVFERSGFRLGKLHAEELIESKRTWGDDFVVLGYELEGSLVGFQCAYRGKIEMEAFFVGFFPELVKSHAIYQRMLIEFILLGIEGKSDRVNMGRTALDVKSSIGALPQRLQCDVHFRNPFFHAVVSRFTRGFDPSQPILKNALKADSHGKRRHSEIHSS